MKNKKQLKKTLTQQEAAAGTPEPLLNTLCQQLKRFRSNKCLAHFPGSQRNWDGTAVDLSQLSEGRKGPGSWGWIPDLASTIPGTMAQAWRADSKLWATAAPVVSSWPRASHSNSAPWLTHRGVTAPEPSAGTQSPGGKAALCHARTHTQGTGNVMGSGGTAGESWCHNLSKQKNKSRVEAPIWGLILHPARVSCILPQQKAGHSYLLTGQLSSLVKQAHLGWASDASSPLLQTSGHSSSSWWTCCLSGCKSPQDAFSFHNCWLCYWQQQSHL